MKVRVFVKARWIEDNNLIKMQLKRGVLRNTQLNKFYLFLQNERKSKRIILSLVTTVI